MEQRMNIAQVEPGAYKGLIATQQYLHTTGLSKIELGLIYIRASQINGCAYCLDMHTKDALKDGETMQRIFVLDGWRETTLFSKEEAVILKMTEEITHITRKGLSEATYEEARSYFDEHKIAQIIMAAVTINAWNRIAISTHLQIGA
ncbi:alkylhydroperoxidase AhpD family core domain-containing protein [Chitinophaga jiangningensis]|uniref:Alkylhydroperoxidase AhpD family core domain-containing protein n=1 Tax=Chitinophaga jiangningensis TaxID=1419482 RepID=A0A1M7JZS2_9BACT|nr:carboxymuconolactone decarboxylase family protein [Chitinophaga jiangningensis]SHM58223.1 alkylhydroperoxidase AhpD family core domain-containing protein [Chitinophaga jiangningensis]